MEIKSFLAPSKGLEKFILDEPKFKDSSLFAIINDGSHGDIFSGENYSNTELKQILEIFTAIETILAIVSFLLLSIVLYFSELVSNSFISLSIAAFLVSYVF